MRWAWHIARLGDRWDAYRVLVGKSEGKRPLGRPIVDENLIFKCIFRKWDEVAWTRLIWLRIWTGGGLL
jgi:hypothetical protein